MRRKKYTGSRHILSSNKKLPGYLWEKSCVSLFYSLVSWCLGGLKLAPDKNTDMGRINPKQKLCPRITRITTNKGLRRGEPPCSPVFFLFRSFIFWYWDLFGTPRFRISCFFRMTHPCLELESPFTSLGYCDILLNHPILASGG